jgi:L-asparaginase II
MQGPRTFDLDIAVTRGGATESVHRVHAAVVDARGDLIAAARDAEQVTFWRSCAKPFQVMPFVESGGFDEVRWGDDELALSVASHGGEPEHVAIAGSMLSDIGLEEGDLACGPHDPLSTRGARMLREAGERPTRLHNNCSGKHAAMLARAQTAGWEMQGYERPEHGVQRSCTESVATWSGIPANKLRCAVDGCGVVVYGMPLRAMAAAYARLVAACERGDEVPTRIVHAVRTRPFLLGGTDRFDSVLLEETDGRMLAKIGAEGVHCVAAFDAGLAVAVKVEDGSMRAQYPAVLRILQMVGALPETLTPRLAEQLTRLVRNSRGETVGCIRPVS